MPKQFNPKVSIVIPVYNGSNYLKEAIDSALAQTYKNIEIIVINDGSNDKGETDKICKSYGNKIRYYRKKNGGVASALNMGIEKMKGEYFSWLSHDDVYYPEKIEKQIEALSKLKDKRTIIYSGYEVVDEGLGLLYKVELSSKFRLEKLNKSLFALLHSYINSLTLLIHKENFRKDRLFNEALNTTQDYDLWFRMFRDSKLYYVPSVLTKTRQHSKQASFALSEIHALENIELWRKILSNLTTEEMVELEGSKVEFFSELYRHFVKNRMNPSISAYILSRLLREVRNSDDYTEIISLLRSVSHQKGLNPLLSNKRNLQEILRNISPKEESPRVVFWSDNWEYLGGLNRMIVRIAKCIAPFFDVFICSWKGLGRTSGFKIPSNIIYREFTRRNYSIEDLPLIMSLLQVDIFICSNAYSIEYLKLCSLLKDYGIKVIVWDHSHYFLAHRQEELHELAVKRLQLLKNVERIVCVNQLSNKIYKSFELPSISINNIVGEKFQKGLNSESSNKAHRAGNTLVAVGRFDEYQKRLDLLIEVFAKIQNQVPDAILYVLGSYNLDIEVSSAMESRETYRQMIRRLGIDEKRIIFKGNVRNIEDYYKKASIQILSSEYEGFGLVILEAACFGTPTVAFSGNGADYIIKNGVNGFLIENYDVDKMASVISSLLTEKNKLARISSNCRKLIDGYTEDKIIPQWIDLINMVNKGESLRGSSYNFSSSETQFVIHEFEKMLSERYREIAWVKYKNGELNNEINLIRNSITWKITKPFRKLEHLFELFKTQGVVRTCKNIILRIYEVALGKR